MNRQYFDRVCTMGVCVCDELAASEALYVWSAVRIPVLRLNRDDFVKWAIVYEFDTDAAIFWAIEWGKSYRELSEK